MKKYFFLATVFFVSLSTAGIILISPPQLTLSDKNHSLLTDNTTTSFEQQLSAKIQKLSPQECEYLENFFQYGVKISSFGHVLFGDKPMSIEYYDLSKPTMSVEGFDYMDEYHIIYKYRFKEGWKALMKYKDLFPSENFIFFEYPHSWNPNFIEICVINKKLFLKVVQEHLEDFRTVIKRDLSPQQILEEYIQGGACFNIIKNHDGLFGTILGYGRDNAWAFMAQPDINNRTIVPLHSEDPEKETEMILPGFMVLPNTKETLTLESQYRKNRDKMKEIFKNKDYLKPTLKKIVYNQ